MVIPAERSASRDRQKMQTRRFVKSPDNAFGVSGMMVAVWAGEPAPFPQAFDDFTFTPQTKATRVSETLP